VKYNKSTDANKKVREYERDGMEAMARRCLNRRRKFFCVVFFLPFSYLACCTTKANAECCDAETINKLRGKGKKE